MLWCRLVCRPWLESLGAPVIPVQNIGVPGRPGALPGRTAARHARPPTCRGLCLGRPAARMRTAARLAAALHPVSHACHEERECKSHTTGRPRRGCAAPRGVSGGHEAGGAARRAPPQAPHVLIGRQAADEGADGEPGRGQPRAERAERVGHLQRDLARRRQHDHLRGCRVRVRPTCAADSPTASGAMRRPAAGLAGAEAPAGAGEAALAPRECSHACMRSHDGAPQGCERAARRTRPPGERRPRRGPGKQQAGVRVAGEAAAATCGAGRSRRARSTAAMPNTAVLPVPDLACTTRSAPARASGTAASCRRRAVVRGRARLRAVHRQCWRAVRRRAPAAPRPPARRRALDRGGRDCVPCTGCAAPGRASGTAASCRRVARVRGCSTACRARAVPAHNTLGLGPRHMRASGTAASCRRRAFLLRALDRLPCTGCAGALCTGAGAAPARESGTAASCRCRALMGGGATACRTWAALARGALVLGFCAAPSYCSDFASTCAS